MERLRAKVQPRSGSSLAAPLASSGKPAGGAGQKINAVLAAGDGHRRSGGGATVGKKRLEGGPSGAGAGVSVSRRARAMGMSATAAKNPALTAAVAATAKPETLVPSSLAGRRKGGEDAERPSGLRRTRKESGERERGADRKEQGTASLLPPPARAAGIEDRNAPTCHQGTQPKAGDENTGGSEAIAERSSGTNRFAGAHDGERQPAAAAAPAERQQRQIQHQPPPPSSENELTPERTATRRAGGATRGRRGAVTGASGNKLLSFRAEAGRGGHKITRPLAGERSLSGAAAAFSSVGAANASSKGSSSSGRHARDSGSGLAGAATAGADEAGLALAMMNILQSAGSDGARVAAAASAAGGGDAGEGKKNVTRRGAGAGAASNLLLATNIVNTVGGGSGGSGAVTAPRSIPSASASPSLALDTPRTDSKDNKTAAAAGKTAGASGAICGPGLVASSSVARRAVAGGGSGMEGDWHLRASRAVGRVRGEEEAAGRAATTGSPVLEDAGPAQAPTTGDIGSEDTRNESRSRSASCYGSTSLDAVGPDKNRPLRGSGVTAPAQRTERISDSDGDSGGDSDWSIGGGGGGSGGAGSVSRRRKQTDGDRGRGATAAAAASSRATAAPEPAAPSRPAGAKKRKQQPANNKKMTSEVSDNFVRADLKSRGSSRFKRKGSGRSKARGGSGGRSFGGGRGGGGGRWGGRGGRGFGGGRFGGGGSKWGGGGNKGTEDPVTGEKGGAPRDRPLSSGAAKNRAGLDVLDQVTERASELNGERASS